MIVEWQAHGSRGILRDVIDRYLVACLFVPCVLACDSPASKPASAPAASATSPAPPPIASTPAIAPPALKPAAPATKATIDPDRVGFFGAPDGDVLTRMQSDEIVAVKKGSGGRSLGFKLTFADGTKAYFKVEQTFSGANWYAEIAAYHLDRMLGLGRVPPVLSRTLPWGRLAVAANGDARVSEVVVRDQQPRADGSANGNVRGALVAWVEGDLQPAITPPGWETWIRVEPWNAYNATPFQRAREYYDALNQRRTTPTFTMVPTPDRPDRAQELSDLLVFDFLTLNIDRWGGDNANVLTNGKAGPLVFLDNGAAFAHGPPQLRLMQDRLAPLQKFRKRTIDALRGLDLDAYASRLAADPNGPILSESDLEGLAIRRIAVLDHVAELQQKHGDSIFF